MTPPPPARLSLAVSRKVIVLAMEGRISPIVVVLLRMSESFGKVRDGLVTGLNDRNIGPVVVETFGGPAGPRSNSSQQ